MKVENSDCIKEKYLECKKFIAVVDMKTHLEVCKEAKRLLEEEKEKEYVAIQYYLTCTVSGVHVHKEAYCTSCTPDNVYHTIFVD